MLMMRTSLPTDDDQAGVIRRATANERWQIVGQKIERPMSWR